MQSIICSQAHCTTLVFSVAFHPGLSPSYYHGGVGLSESIGSFSSDGDSGCGGGGAGSSCSTQTISRSDSEADLSWAEELSQAVSLPLHILWQPVKTNTTDNNAANVCV